jgi:hypothetical protein
MQLKRLEFDSFIGIFYRSLVILQLPLVDKIPRPSRGGSVRHTQHPFICLNLEWFRHLNLFHVFVIHQGVLGWSRGKLRAWGLSGKTHKNVRQNDIP